MEGCFVGGDQKNLKYDMRRTKNKHIGIYALGTAACRRIRGGGEEK